MHFIALVEFMCQASPHGQPHPSHTCALARLDFNKATYKCSRLSVVQYSHAVVVIAISDQYNQFVN